MKGTLFGDKEDGGRRSTVERKFKRPCLTRLPLHRTHTIFQYSSVVELTQHLGDNIYSVDYTTGTSHETVHIDVGGGSEQNNTLRGGKIVGTEASGNLEGD